MRINGGIYARQNEWESKPSYYTFMNHTSDMSRSYHEAQEWVYICDCDLEFEELSPGVFAARQIAGLRMKKEALREAFVKESTKVEEKIQNLLAITDESHEG